MSELPLQFEVLLFALVDYGVILAATMFMGGPGGGSGGFDEPGPGPHVGHKGWAQALVRQVLSGHRKGDRNELRIAGPFREIVVQDRRSADQHIVRPVIQHL